MPTKALVHTAEVISLIKKSSELGIEIAEMDIDFSKVMARKDTVVNVDVYKRQVIKFVKVYNI